MGIITGNGQVPGAVFDLPENMAKGLLSLTIGTGEIVEAPKKVHFF